MFLNCLPRTPEKSEKLTFCNDNMKIEIININNRIEKNVKNNIIEMIFSSDFDNILNKNDIKLK